MGKCGCGKRSSVLFCYQHGENVCYECLDTEKHRTCDIRSTQAWLSDVDVCKHCELCKGDLAAKQTVRLNCLHVFHWECLDHMQRNLPSNTAPAGRKCPICTHPIIPPANSWFASQFLKQTLSNVDWGKVAPPQIQDFHRPPPQQFVNPPPASSVQEQQAYNERHHADYVQPVEHAANRVPPAPPVFANHQTNEVHFHASAQHHVNEEQFHTAGHQQTLPEFSNGDPFASLSQRTTTSPSDAYTIHHRDQDNVPLLDNDSDERKYERRPAHEWLRGLWRSRYGSSTPRFLRSKLLIVIMGLVFLMILFVLLSRRGDDDPMFDPLANPNIRIAQE